MHVYYLGVPSINSQPYCHKEKFSKVIYNSEKAQMGKQFVTCSKYFSKQATWWMLDSGNVGPTHSVVTPENTMSLTVVVQRYPTTSVCRLAAQSGIKACSTGRILKETLHMFPYKIQCQHAIPVRDGRQREDFVNVMLDMIDDSGFDVWSNIVFRRGQF